MQIKNIDRDGNAQIKNTSAKHLYLTTMISKNNTNIYSQGERIYCSPENRHKHRWSKNYAGFAKYHGEIVGKCPNDITLDEAQKLLSEAVTDPPDDYDIDPYPKRLYNVYRGVIYRAEGDGRSNVYHAFPADNIDSMDRNTLEALEQRVEPKYLKIFKKWKEDHARRRN